MRGSLFATGRLDELGAIQHRAEALALTLGDERRLGWSRVHLLNFYVSLGRIADAKRYATLARESAVRTGDRTLGDLISVQVSAAQYSAGEYAASAGEASEALKVLGSDVGRRGMGGNTPSGILLKGRLCAALAYLGRFEDAVREGQDALSLARTAENHFAEAFVAIHLAQGLCLRGDFREASLLCERILELVAQSGMSPFLPAALAAAAYARVMTGRVSDALALAARAVESPPVMKYGHSAAMLNVARVSLIAGRTEQALEQASRTLEAARTLGERGVEADAHHVQADILGTVPDRVSRATASLEVALALSEQMGMRPLTARCHLDLGVLVGATGDRTSARAHLAVATDLLREMRMNFWLDRAQDEIRRVSY
jgi:tetratricopeptide (TPR) repeat protein